MPSTPQHIFFEFVGNMERTFRSLISFGTGFLFFSKQMKAIERDKDVFKRKGW